jgi:hypothetical protein
MNDDIGPSSGLPSLRPTPDTEVRKDGSDQTAETELQGDRRGGRRRGAGRKRIQLNPEHVEKLYALGCTNAEVAAFFMCSVRTIEIRSKKPPFAAVKVRGQASLHILLRRSQLKLAEKGNPGMLKWLGKQVLGQRDQVPFSSEPQRRALTSLELEQADQSIQRLFGIWISEADAKL